MLIATRHFVQYQTTQDKTKLLMQTEPVRVLITRTLKKKKTYSHFVEMENSLVSDKELSDGANQKNGNQSVQRHNHTHCNHCRNVEALS